MRRLLIGMTVVLLAVSAVGCGPSQPPGRSGCRREVLRPLARWSDVGFTGAVASSSGGRVCAGGAGPATADTVFDVGSVTKTFTAAAVLSLVEDGTVTLDDPARRWLPELSGPVGLASVRQLLTHTAGLGEAHGDDEEPLSLEDALAAIDAQELLFEPGEDVAYSNSGYTLLAAIVERASGRPFRTFLTAEVLTLRDGSVAGGFWHGEPAPRGRRAGSSGVTGFAGPYWATEGNGGVAMSVRDLHDWTVALSAGEILSPASVELMTEPQVEVDGGSLTFGWGTLDPALGGTPGVATMGGGGSVGHDVTLFWFPATGRVVALASSSPAVTAEHLAPHVVTAILAGEPVPGPVRSVPTPPSRLAGIEGTYRLDDDSTVTVSGLHVSASSGVALAALHPVPADLGPDAAAEHEALVETFLRGGTADGRAELEALAEAYGPLRSWAVLGTAYLDGELRTYVDLTADETIVAWLALDDLGGLAGAEYPTVLPGHDLVETSDGSFVPARTVMGDDPVVSLTFGPDRVRLTAPDGSDVTGTRR